MRAFGTLATAGLLLLPTHLPKAMEAGAAVVPSLTVHQGVIERNASLATTISEWVSPAGVHELVEAARPAWDLARLSVGHPWGLALDERGRIAVFTYRIDELTSLKLVRRGRDVLEPELTERRYQVRAESASGEISSSLFAAVTDAGEGDQLALEMAEIFAWDIDFNTEIRRGDSFRVSVEKLYLDGEFRRYGDVLAARFVRGDRTLQAIRFAASAGTGYYAPDGTPLRKAFLRSPLKFSRISSGFTHRRLHPITKRVRPHLGVDYAAPRGTPVRASADGVVAEAGTLGGLGRAVRLRHANGFETLYGHLSRIRVRRGQRVSQGDHVGDVGSTGLATGPHLDYRMKRDGRFINPLTLQSPPAEPIPAAEMAAFVAVRDRSLALLDVPTRRLARR
jgi:murein DD-endopeptidase MepM/ murein hydrolase activator NlpD